MIPLSYDDLPPGSDIRRELSDGVLRITVPFSEIPEGAKRRALPQAMTRGAITSLVLLLPACALFVSAVKRNRIGGVELAVAWIAFGVFCCALVAMFVRVWTDGIVEQQRLGRSQVTVLRATPGRLLVETKGPFGFGSYDVPAADIVSIRPKLGWMVTSLVIRLKDGRAFSVLTDREPGELIWAAGALRQVLRPAEKQEVRPA